MESKDNINNNAISQQLIELQQQMDKMRTAFDKTTILNDDNMCSICFINNKNTLLLHSNGNEGHLCCCEDCGKLLIQNSKICPVCRTPITHAIRAF
jgi:hypothetical protein